eukprot:scaffold8916_cov122-Isochrysis_galbana.AAC.2
MAAAALLAPHPQSRLLRPGNREAARPELVAIPQGELVLLGSWEGTALESPGKPCGEIDNRGSTFYIAKNWAAALAERDASFKPLATELAAKEQAIVKELIDCQGPPVDIGTLKHTHAGGGWAPGSRIHTLAEGVVAKHPDESKVG